MIIHDEIQGTESWLELRKNYYPASLAPCVMNDGYDNRNTAMSKYLGFTVDVISPFAQKMFDSGHAKEAIARPMAEDEYIESFFPLVGSKTIEGLPLLASFDGITGDHRIVWEHKHTAKVFDEIPALYYWQLEQQILVSGAEKAILTITQKPSGDIKHYEYFSLPERRAALLAGWHQWKDDCVTFQPVPKKEVVIANEQADFPLIECRVEGSLVISNLGEYIPMIKGLAEEQMSIVLETDQDFADKEAFNKKVKEGRASLKTTAKDIESKFNSLADFNGFVKEADTILQKLQSHGEKQVKESKEQKKHLMLIEAKFQVASHLDQINRSLKYEYISYAESDWIKILKGKRNFESMQNALDSEIASIKIETNAKADLIRKNLSTLKELCGDYRHLFADHATLMLKDNDDLTNLIKSRISDHKAAEKAKQEAMREQIRLEEEAKARKKVEAEAQAKALEEANEAARTFAEEKAKVEVKEVKKKEAPKPVETVKEIKPVEQQEEVSLVTNITAMNAEDSDGYNLYLGSRKVGYLESNFNVGSELTILFPVETAKTA